MLGGAFGVGKSDMKEPAGEGARWHRERYGDLGKRLGSALVG